MNSLVTPLRPKASALDRSLLRGGPHRLRYAESSPSSDEAENDEMRTLQKNRSRRAEERRTKFSEAAA